VLDAAVAAVLADAGDPPALEHLRALPPALARLVVRRLADGAAVAHRTEEILALAEGQALDVGEGLRATIDQGRLRFVPTPPRVRA
jgi:tRNA(Ile)-lysidine synthase